MILNLNPQSNVTCVGIKEDSYSQCANHKISCKEARLIFGRPNMAYNNQYNDVEKWYYIIYVIEFCLSGSRGTTVV